MMLRMLPIRVGARVLTRGDCHQYPLPAGLPANVEVKVISWDPKTYNHVVRDAGGREWTIQATQNLDAGQEYRLNGRWLPPDHPDVVAERQRRKEG